MRQDTLHNKSIADALELLLDLAGRTTPIGIRELARTLNMEVSRTSRFLQTLCRSGFLVQDEKRRYHSGPGMQLLAARSIFACRLLHAAIPVLKQLEPLTCFVALGTLYRDQVCYLLHAEPGMKLVEGIIRRATASASNSSIGMALLAEQNDAAVRGIYGDRTNLLGGYADCDALLVQLQHIREEGCARIPVWHNPKMRNIACVVGSPVLGALALSDLPASEEKTALKRLKSLAAEITSILSSDGMPQNTSAALPKWKEFGDPILV